jgi:hypothetical protein
MAGVFTRLLRAKTLPGATTPDTDESFDAGGFREIVCQIRVTTAGSAGTIKLQHAATNDDAAFTDITGFSAVSLTATTNNVQAITGFLRWIRYTTGTVPTGGPVVIIDLVAKE